MSFEAAEQDWQRQAQSAQQQQQQQDAMDEQERRIAQNGNRDGPVAAFQGFVSANLVAILGVVLAVADVALVVFVGWGLAAFLAFVGGLGLLWLAYRRSRVSLRETVRQLCEAGRVQEAYQQLEGAEAWCMPQLVQPMKAVRLQLTDERFPIHVRLATAEPVLAKMNHIAARALQEDSPHFVQSLMRFAESYHAMGAHHKALPLFSAVKELLLLLKGSDSREFLLFLQVMERQECPCPPWRSPVHMLTLTGVRGQPAPAPAPAPPRASTAALRRGYAGGAELRESAGTVPGDERGGGRSERPAPAHRAARAASRSARSRSTPSLRCPPVTPVQPSLLSPLPGTDRPTGWPWWVMVDGRSRQRRRHRHRPRGARAGPAAGSPSPWTFS